MGTRMRITGQATVHDYTKAFAHLVPEEQRNPRTLQSYIDEFHGSLEGEVEDPCGLMQPISLKGFKDLDRHTYIKLTFTTAPDGVDFPPEPAGAIILREYEIPEGATLPGA